MIKVTLGDSEGKWDLIKYHFKYFKISIRCFIDQIKMFFIYGNAFKNEGDSWMGECLERFVVLKTDRFLKCAKRRDSHYVNGDKYLKKAKVLNHIAKRLISYDLPPTIYDKEIEELEIDWWKNSGIREDELIRIPFTIKNKDGAYESITGDVVDRYNNLILKQFKQEAKIHKSDKEIFFKYLKDFSNLDW